MSDELTFVCPECRFDVWFPMSRLSASIAGMTSDARFPGRSIVVLDHHAEHLEDLDVVTYRRFMDDVRVVSKAIRSALAVPRVNVAVLGNQEPHVHAHIFPRGSISDPLPNQSPWHAFEPKVGLAQAEQDAIAVQITRAINEISDGVDSSRH